MLGRVPYGAGINTGLLDKAGSRAGRPPAACDDPTIPQPAFVLMQQLIPGFPRFYGQLSPEKNLLVSAVVEDRAWE